MNNDISEIIKNYLSEPQTDYALLLDGPWGSGKTYYITDELRKLIKSNKYEFVYISLNGVDNFEKIKRKIIYRLLYKVEEGKSIDSDFIDDLIDVSTTIPKAGSVISSINSIKKIIENKKVTSIDFVKTFFVFDDLERIYDDTLRINITGLIYENYVKKGGKTLFVTDEKNITDDQYHKIKEKIIRRTIAYKPDFEKQMKYFIKNKYSEYPVYKKLKEYIDEYIHYLSILKIRNLRTISFILDNHFYIIQNLKDDFVKKYNSFLFQNIMILTKEFKQGHISIKDIEEKKELDRLTQHPIFWDLDKKKEEEKSFAEKFYEKYNLRYLIKFIFVESIFKYILTGTINMSELEDEIIALFENIKPASETVIDELTDARKKEENDVIQAMIKFVKYLKKGEYNIARLPYLYTLLKNHESNQYIPDWNYNVEDIINSSFSEAIKDENKIPKNSYNLHLHPYDERYTKEPYYGELIKQIKDKADQKECKEKKIKINEIFDLAITNDDRIWDFISDFKYPNLFLDIVGADLMGRFFELSNNGIQYFETYLHCEILRISNAGEHGYSQKESLEIVKDFLKRNIENQDLNHMRKRRFNDLCDMIDRSLFHLENTKKQK